MMKFKLLSWIVMTLILITGMLAVVAPKVAIATEITHVVGEVLVKPEGESTFSRGFVRQPLTNRDVLKTAPRSVAVITCSSGGVGKYALMVCQRASPITAQNAQGVSALASSRRLCLVEVSR